jgi:hypothetical protein
MFTKTLLAALILASASVALTSRVNAGPKYDSPASGDTRAFDRESNPYNGGAGN